MKKTSEIFSVSFKTNSIFVKAHKHSRRVRFLKIVLPMITAILALVFSWFTFFSASRSTNVILLNNEEKQNNKLVMTAPKVEGYTSDNKLYSLVADRAVQDPRHTGIIELQYIRAVLPFGEQGQAIVNAQIGIFDNINSWLELSCPFIIQTSDGITARLLSADVDIGTSQLTTTDKIEISRENEFLIANGMRVLDNGQRILFNGKVKLIIGPTTMDDRTDILEGVYGSCNFPH
ncbi:MAG: lipopolysaccharide export system protein LptC [Candidatus Tokpelaia sp. JSC189]|nr:MAG: lipopolysaccharide export system protein LptC [Candidatus Tokpelaia sp. JSC189]